MESRDKKRRILIIDDDLDILLLLADVFHHYGFEINTQSNPFLALKTFEENPKYYDLVVLDIRLDEMDGQIVYKKLKECDPDTKICVFTATNLDVAEFKKIFPTFEERYLIKKPIRMSVLVERINSVLN